MAAEAGIQRIVGINNFKELDSSCHGNDRVFPITKQCLPGEVKDGSKPWDDFTPSGGRGRFLQNLSAGHLGTALPQIRRNGCRNGGINRVFSVDKPGDIS
jgi:hypothetical protein